MRRIVLLAFVAFLLAAPGALADGLSVYVGYTDGHRPGGSNFPTSLCSTWSPTCQVDQGAALDGGVFRIDNTGSNPITISDITVTLNPTAGPVTFALWQDVTILAGSSATFGQTMHESNGDTNFDTSDYPLLSSDPGVGINGIGGCSTPSALSAAQQKICSANLPIISFDENGNPVTLVDKGSILNHGGYDSGNVGVNESSDWSLVGSVSSTPEPGSLTLLGIGMIGLAGVFLRSLKG